MFFFCFFLLYGLYTSVSVHLSIVFFLYVVICSPNPNTHSYFNSITHFTCLYLKFFSTVLNFFLLPFSTLLLIILETSIESVMVLHVVTFLLNCHACFLAQLISLNFRLALFPVASSESDSLFVDSPVNVLYLIFLFVLNRCKTVHMNYLVFSNSLLMITLGKD